MRFFCNTKKLAHVSRYRKLDSPFDVTISSRSFTPSVHPEARSFLLYFFIYHKYYMGFLSVGRLNNILSAFVFAPRFAYWFISQPEKWREKIWVSKTNEDEIWYSIHCVQFILVRPLFYFSQQHDISVQSVSYLRSYGMEKLTMWERLERKTRELKTHNKKFMRICNSIGLAESCAPSRHKSIQNELTQCSKTVTMLCRFVLCLNFLCFSLLFAQHQISLHSSWYWFAWFCVYNILFADC